MLCVRYAVAAATDAHLDTDYKDALIDAAAGSGDKLTRDMVKTPKGAESYTLNPKP
jgi:hypothetical protein